MESLEKNAKKSEKLAIDEKEGTCVCVVIAVYE